MKSNLLFIFIFFGQFLSAQTFMEVSGTPFSALSSGSIAFVDVDGINGQDVLITGSGKSKLYINDGMGNFTEVMNTPFDGVSTSSIAFADVDGDNDQDVLITGFIFGGQKSKLYTNDGDGNFTEVSDTPFVGVSLGSIAFANVDGINGSDVLITGITSSFERIAKLYTNDGMGNFTEVLDTPFMPVNESSIAFADVNGDNFQDVLITGANNSSTVIARLYTNDGMGNFTEVLDTPFVGFQRSSIAFADVNGDHSQDVLITGWSSGVGKAKLYTNDGFGNFTEVLDTPFDGVKDSSIAFADVNGDNFQDVLITGENSSGAKISKLYTNDGMGNFTEVLDTPFVGVKESSIAFADVDGDSDQDVLITGRNSSFIEISKLYLNQSIVSSTEILVSGSNFGLMLYPNPTSAIINLELERQLDYQIDLYDVYGQLIYKNIKNHQIDLSPLPIGTYLLKIRDIATNQSACERIVLTR